MMIKIISKIKEIILPSLKLCSRNTLPNLISLLGNVEEFWIPSLLGDVEELWLSSSQM
jgi:hypothetical protein